MLQTVCHDWHVAHGGRMVDFAGWEMPVQYTTITAEHNAVRTACGLFDIAHMGRFEVTGPAACRFLDYVLTRNVASLDVGRIRYSLVVNEQGGILDDVLVYRFDKRYVVVVNASNRLKLLEWFNRYIGKYDVSLTDQTLDWSMLALQGPHAKDFLAPLVNADIGSMKYYRGVEATIFGSEGIVSRTGYSGEDGFEAIVPAEAGLQIWEELIERGASAGLLPCGLGARDTLRFEAAMPLYGHEMDETIDPFTAGLGFGVDLDKSSFVGRDALLAAVGRSDRPVRVGLELASRRIAREGALLMSGDEQIGRVTSGTFSPTLQKSIAMGYVPAEKSTIGTALEVDIRGKREAAQVVPIPFYSRPKSNS